MWHQKQNNDILPGRVMAPFRSQASHDGHSKVPAPADGSDRDFLVELPRKRKAVAVDYPGNSPSGSQPISGNQWPNESTDQHKFGVFSIMNEQGNTMRGFPNLSSPPLESGVKVFQPGYQSQGLYTYSLNTQISDNNFPNVVAEKTTNFHSSTQPPSCNQKEPSNIFISPAGNIPTLPEPQFRSYNSFSHTEAHKHPYPGPLDTSMGKAFSGHISMDGRNFGDTTHIIKGNSLMDSSSKTSVILRSSEMSQINNEVVHHDVNLDERMLTEYMLKTGSSFEMKQNVQALGVEKTMGNSIVRTSSLETARPEGNVTEQSSEIYNSKARTGSPPNNGVTSELKLRDQNNGDHDIQVIEGHEGSSMENGNNSLEEDVSPRNADNPTHVLTEHGHGEDSQHVATKLDARSKLNAEKSTPITEKLWDGSLQLSASVTVSAVAFFKSGEKAPEVKWSKSIVVKGKVRLEAFERFIQELPRSRSRGLMVTSLCWRVGSSKTGLGGMKEVAQGYKEEDKVGFAQLSRGIDLYVCPRSDAIITILAKYGFFKGMAALEEDQDSLIGCIVWRRNHQSSDSVTKKSKNKISPVSEQPLESTSNPLISQTEKNNSPITHPGERFSPLVLKNGSAPLNIPGSNSIQLSEVQIEVGNSASISCPEKTHLVPHSSSAMSVGLNSTNFSVSCTPNSLMNQQVQTPVMRSPGPEQSRAGLEPARPDLLASAQTVTLDNRPAPYDDKDDDDLPEFDFGIACGFSQNSVSKTLLPSTSALVSDAVSLGMKVPSEVAKNGSGFMPSALPAVQPTTIASQQRSLEQAMTFPVVSGMSQPSNPANHFGEGESIKPAVSFSDEKPMAHGNELSGQPGIGNPTTSMASPAPKNRWDDDDDMPEWCPPDLEYQSRPAMMSTMRPSIPCIPSPVPNRRSDNKLPGPPPRPPRMATMRPSSSYIPSPPNQVSENIPPGLPPTMGTSRPSSSYLPSPVPNRNILPGPPPGPPPTMATSKPSISYIPSSVPNIKSENMLPGPPQLLPLPPPPPPPPLMSIRPPFHSQGLSNGYQSSIAINVQPEQTRPVSGRAPIGPNTSMGFTYNPTSRPQANKFEIRPPIVPTGWRGWRP